MKGTFKKAFSLALLISVVPAFSMEVITEIVPNGSLALAKATVQTIPGKLPAYAQTPAFRSMTSRFLDFGKRQANAAWQLAKENPYATAGIVAGTTAVGTIAYNREAIANKVKANPKITIGTLGLTAIVGAAAYNKPEARTAVLAGFNSAKDAVVSGKAKEAVVSGAVRAKDATIFAAGKAKDATVFAAGKAKDAGMFVADKVATNSRYLFDAVKANPKKSGVIAAATVATLGVTYGIYKYMTRPVAVKATPVVASLTGKAVMASFVLSTPVVAATPEATLIARAQAMVNDARVQALTVKFVNSENGQKNTAVETLNIRIAKLQNSITPVDIQQRSKALTSVIALVNEQLSKTQAAQ
ncbi:MAG: hypothetical protein NTX86_03895 [Candidatus Dependentiae bacterium]|nr:hypothetical protein [Candidatus Dependentiae bacterium]